MPEIFAKLLVPLLLLLQVFGLLILHRVALPLVRGLLGGFAEQKGFRKWFFHAIGLNALANAVAWVVHRVRQALANAAYANLDLAHLYLRDFGVLWHYTYKELGDGWAHYADSWALFRHGTLPHAIKQQTIPAVAGAARAGQIAGRSISLGNANRIRFGRSIDKLRKELGLLAGILLGIDILVKHGHAAKHHHDHTHTLPDAAAGAAAAGAEAARLGKIATRHDALLKRLAKLLTIAGLGALMWRVLLKWKLGWLRCTKVRQVGAALCGLDQLLIDAFLLEAGILSTPFSIEHFARIMQTPTRDLLSGLHYLVSEVEEFTAKADTIWTKGSTAHPVPDL